MWDQRYSEADPAYGDQPNSFLVEVVGRLAKGDCLCLAEGQGRNAVWLAGRGFAVTAVDLSGVGLACAQELAEKRGVQITTQVANLADYDLGEARWDTIVSIFGHLPSALRKKVHKAVVRALKPGGTFCLEAYSPAQLATTGTGGPADADMLPSLEDLLDDLAGLDFDIAQETHRDINEGRYHFGEAAVVQIVARKGL